MTKKITCPHCGESFPLPDDDDDGLERCGEVWKDGKITPIFTVPYTHGYYVSYPGRIDDEQ